MKKTEKEQYQARIKELEECLKHLETKSGKGAEEKGEETLEAEGTAANILETLGKSFGLSGLIKSVSKMPEFQDRLAEIDEELRTRLSEGPIGREAPPIRRSRRGVSGIPPRTKRRRPGRRPVRPRAEPPPEPSRKVDVFDEEDHVLVVCEIPGSEKDKIKVTLTRDKLSINAEKAHRKAGKFQKELILPCTPEGELFQNYRNGILRIKIMKAKPKK